MAIIDSVLVGRGKKSAGNITLRLVRGRVIASQKISSSNGTRALTDAQTRRTVVFGLVARYMAIYKKDIAISFDKTKYGSSRNYFSKINQAALADALSAIVDEVIAVGGDVFAVSDSAILAAVVAYATANPASIYRVKRSGFPIKYLTGAWSSADNPVPSEPDKPAKPVTVKLNGVNVLQGSGALTNVVGKTFAISGTGVSEECTVFVSNEDPSSNVSNGDKLTKFLSAATAGAESISGTFAAGVGSSEIGSIIAADGTTLFSFV